MEAAGGQLRFESSLGRIYLDTVDKLSKLSTSVLMCSHHAGRRMFGGEAPCVVKR